MGFCVRIAFSLFFALTLPAVTAPALASPVSVECSQNNLQSLANHYFARNDTTIPAESAARSIDADIAACIGNPAAHKLATLAYSGLTERTLNGTGPALDFAEAAVRHGFYMLSTSDGHTAAYDVIDAEGKPIKLQLSDTYEVSRMAVERLIVADARSVRRMNLATIFPPGGPPLECDIDARSLSQHAAGILRKTKSYTPGAASFLQLLIGACPTVNKSAIDMLSDRADVIMRALEANPTQPNALELLSQAYADSEAILTAQPEGAFLGWKPSSRDQLDRVGWRVILGQNLSVSLEEVMTPDQLEKPWAGMLIARLLDAAYAEDAKIEGPNTYPSYRKVISTAFSKINVMPNEQSAQAKALLYKAAQRHAQGVWIDPSHKALPAPKEFLYSWLKPPAPEPPKP